MNVTINIEDAQLNEQISKGINSLDDETVKDIAKQALREVFKNTEMARDLLFERDTIYNYKLRGWAEAAIKKTLTEEDFKQFKEIVFSAIAEHAKDIIVEVLVKTFVNNMFTYEQQHIFSEKLINSIKEGISHQ